MGRQAAVCLDSMIHLSATATATASGSNKMANSITTETFSVPHSLLPLLLSSSSSHPTISLHAAVCAIFIPFCLPSSSESVWCFSNPQSFSGKSFSSVPFPSTFIHPSILPSLSLSPPLVSLRHHQKMCSSSENYHRCTSFPHSTSHRLSH